MVAGSEARSSRPRSRPVYHGQPERVVLCMVRECRASRTASTFSSTMNTPPSCPASPRAPTSTLARSLGRSCPQHSTRQIPIPARGPHCWSVIPNAYERAQQGLREARSGQGIRLGPRTCNPVAAVVLTLTAVADLERLTTTHRLPVRRRDRVKSSLGPLTTFPLLGPPLTDRWQGFHFILGPWSWMLCTRTTKRRTTSPSSRSRTHDPRSTGSQSLTAPLRPRRRP